MKKVDVLFQNIQSHENTQFFLTPGVNFILADDNNVGKSTIFKVFSTIAKAPNVNADKLESLIRNGCTEAFAAFSYDGEKVVACFTKYGKEAAKLFFEHTHSDGQITRTVFCPKSLLDALGIAIGENENVLNFNDADSVQLITKTSVEADTVLTHVMLDPDVEKIKQNLYLLGREVNSDGKVIQAQLEAAKQTVKELHYLAEVEEFEEQLEVMQAACRIGDTNFGQLGQMKELPSLRELFTLEIGMKVVRGLQGLIELQELPAIPNLEFEKVEAANRVLRALGSVDWKVLSNCSSTHSNLESSRLLYGVCSKLLSGVRSAEQLTSLGRLLTKAAIERQRISETLRENSELVECPLKGKVYYTDEKCLPYHN